MPSTFTRTTKQRNAVVEILKVNAGFLSAQALHAILRNSGSTIGLSTVYRTMTSMVKTGEVDVVLREDGEALYRLCSSAHHHHLVCKHCGTTVEIQADFVEAWANDVSKAHGFSEIEHTVEIVGTCRDCAK
jgi:Fur family ferric uptake transcriptional regulator